MKHRYLVQWDNGSYLQFEAGKFLSMAELQFVIWFHFCNDAGFQMPEKMADKAMQGYSTMMIGISRQYWSERK